ncbi:MAG: aspartate kinase [Clostridia bacterium]|nr:aspartate kinase [Clostridia bacterium]
MQGKNCKVAKFGGTSLCDAAHFKKIKDLSERFGNEHCIVVSAPGKRNACDIKVTDMLYRLYDMRLQGKKAEADELKCAVTERYSDIASELGIEFSPEKELDFAMANVGTDDTSADELVSRGEYLCAKLLAKYLGYTFIDAAELIFFDEYGVLMMKKTLRAISKRLRETEKAVIPGFYGTEAATGKIRTFTRGGSDITGALIARGVDAKIYENWTDVSGFYVTDPRLVPEARKVDKLCFNELRELSCMGASVLHGSTVLPLMGSDISIRVCNTNAPDEKGTLICPAVETKNRIAGIAGKRGYTIVTIKKLALGDDGGFARRALHAFEACSVPVEHMPLSMDNLSVVTFTSSLNEKKEMLTQELTHVLGDISVEFSDGISLVAAVSSMLGQSADAVCTLFNALAKNHIRIRLIDTGSGSDSVVAGVDDDDFERAIRAIYSEFEENGYL